MTKELWTKEKIREFADAMGLKTYPSLTMKDQIRIEKSEGPNKAFDSLVQMLLKDGVCCSDLGGTGCLVLPQGLTPNQPEPTPAPAPDIVDLVLAAGTDGLAVQYGNVFNAGAGFVSVSKSWSNAGQVLQFARFEQLLKDNEIPYEKSDLTTWDNGEICQIKIHCKVVPVPPPTKTD